MNLLPRKEILETIRDTNNSVSLWSFVNSEMSKDLLSEDERKNFSDWITKINQWHHNNKGFYPNLKELFSKDGQLNFIEGQEDIGVLRLENESVIVRNADMGLSISLHSPKLKELSIKEWKNFEKIISLLDIGLIDAKNFHSLISFDKMNHELKNKDSKKETKLKL